MTRLAIPIGAILLALAVAAGAFGAHGLRARLDARSLELWETAARYLVIAGFGVVAVGLSARPAGGWMFDAAGLLLVLGGLVFSGTVGAIALGAPRWLGAVTPLGGLGLILGFLALAVAAFRG